MTNADIPTWSPDEACCARCAHYLPPRPRWNTPPGCRVLPDPEPGSTVTYCVAYTPCVAVQDAADAHLGPDAILAAPSATAALQRGVADPHGGQGTTSRQRLPEGHGKGREDRDTFFPQKNEATT
jgi:hypothetical protein